MDIKSELTGTVWQVPAQAGQAVNSGDVLVILESMKMEIPVEAPRDGTVGRVHVAAGDSVSAGQVLVTLE